MDEPSASEERVDEITSHRAAITLHGAIARLDRVKAC
jgi:hypothetical protein